MPSYCRGRKEGYAAAILDDHKRVRKAKEEAAAIAKQEAEVSSHLILTIYTVAYLLIVRITYRKALQRR
jgi:hypothetical protein